MKLGTFENIKESATHVSFDVVPIIPICPSVHVEADLVSIEEACANCPDFHVEMAEHFGTKEACRKQQKLNGEPLGFKTISCPEQFRNEIDT